MAMRNAVSKTLGCTDCRQWLLTSFIVGIGGPAIRPVSQRRSFNHSVTGRMIHGARTTQKPDTNLQSMNDVLSNLNQPDSNAEQLSTPSVPPRSPPPEPAPSDYLPWYLQPQHHPSPSSTPSLPSRQLIPDLPEHPPALLEPALQYISDDLGMDDLTLLDLRRLDPPPALGANLLMVVCTARSEKHLHIAADRLCRWLRTTQNLSPYADGLLGRNEIKLKLRRVAKRSRLLSAVGAKTASSTEDGDGIRTGWVCVNFGRVPGGHLPSDVKSFQRAEGMIGFGAKVEGCSIVVQMFTQEKRTEIDLEKLWNGILQRALRGEVDKQAESYVETPDLKDEARDPNAKEEIGEMSSSRSVLPLRHSTAL